MPLTLALNPQARCRLELNGRDVELSAQELAALRDCLRDDGRSALSALPRDLFRRLFEAGILVAEQLAPHVDAAYWANALPSLSLSPYLSVRPRLRLSEPAGPRVEQAIAMFLDPEFTEAAEQLHDEIHRALIEVARACVVRGSPFPHESALALVHRVVAQWVRPFGPLARWVEVGPDRLGAPPKGRTGENIGASVELPTGPLVPRPQALCPDDQPAFDAITLCLLLGNTAAVARRTDVVVRLDEVPAVFTVIEALAAGRAGSLNPEALAQPAVLRVLGAIESLGGLVQQGVPSPRLDPVADTDVALAVTHIGHAALVIDGGGRRVLVDPWLFPWDDSFEQQPPTPSQLGRVDAIFYTHHHTDHLVTHCLAMLPHDVPVFVPRRTANRPGPRMAPYLRLMGFRDVRELGHGASVSIGDGMEVRSIPFYGEGSDRLGYSANCYLVSARGRNVLVHADASPDSRGRSLVGTGELQALTRQVGAIDVAYGSWWWRDRQFAYQLSPLAVFSLPPAQWLDPTEVCDCPPEFVRALADVCQASMLVYYADSGSGRYRPREQESAYLPSVSLLWPEAEELRRFLREVTGARLVEAQPYQRVVIPLNGAPWVDESDVAASRRERRVEHMSC